LVFDSARHHRRKAIQQHKYSASSCTHSASCIALRSSLRRKTEALRRAGSGPSGFRSLDRRRGLGHIFPPRDFFSKVSPSKTEQRWRDVRGALRQISMRSCLLFHKRHSAHAAPTTRLWHRSCRAMATPTALQPRCHRRYPHRAAKACFDACERIHDDRAFTDSRNHS
jgi:hypothetical protein